MDRNKKKLENVNHHFNYFLKDFDSDSGDSSEDKSAFIKIRIPKPLKPEPYIIFIIFVHLKKYSFAGKSEKVNWVICLKFKGVAITFSHQKFGLNVYACNKSKNASSIVKESLKQIIKATPFAEALVKPLLDLRLEQGRFSIPNNYTELRQRYRFFRDKAEHSFEQVEELRIGKNIYMGRNHNLVIEATNYSVAMLDAYFSLLEHILVLLRPFTFDGTSTTSISKFIKSDWNTQFKEIFNVESNLKSESHLNKLSKVKEHYRNVFAHGNLQKENRSFYIHMDHIGALPFTLTKSDNSFIFNFNKLHPIYYHKICKDLDSFDSFIKRGRTKYGMMYIEAALFVAYDRDSLNAYQAAMKSESKFKKYVLRSMLEEDIKRNMDW
ncbi:MAG: hypothetical protein WA960_16465 [Tunicatimonas sp.]